MSKARPKIEIKQIFSVNKWMNDKQKPTYPKADSALCSPLSAMLVLRALLKVLLGLATRSAVANSKYALRASPRNMSMTPIGFYCHHSESGILSTTVNWMPKMNTAHIPAVRGGARCGGMLATIMAIAIIHGVVFVHC